MGATDNSAVLVLQPMPAIEAQRKALPIGDIMGFVSKPYDYFDEDPREELRRVLEYLRPYRACRELGARLERAIEQLYWAALYVYPTTISNFPLPAGDVRFELEQIHNELAKAWVECPAIVNLEHAMDTLNRSEIRAGASK
jgi:hypothetical protein